MLKNTPDSYGTITKSFHWTTSILVICLLAIGVYMDLFAELAERIKLMPWHKSFGIVVLILAVGRVCWHLYSRPAGFVPSLKKWEKTLARVIHYFLYFSIFAMPLSGWLLSSAAGRTVKFFDLFELPDLIEKSDKARELFSTVHWYVGYSLLAAVLLHLAGALKHHFIDRDPTLRRMLPFGSGETKK